LVVYCCREHFKQQKASRNKSFRTGLNDALSFLAEKQAMGRSGSLAYITPNLRSFEAVGVHEKLQKLC
jgi:topoisomerase IA-like protein